VVPATGSTKITESSCRMNLRQCLQTQPLFSCAAWVAISWLWRRLRALGTSEGHVVPNLVSRPMIITTVDVRAAAKFSSNTSPPRKLDALFSHSWPSFFISVAIQSALLRT
jgi:hypothetical protein